MSPLDSILGIMFKLSADELHLGTNQAPRMYSKGSQKRLSIDETSEGELRHILGAILSPERESQMRREGSLEIPYHSPELGTFRVHLLTRPAGVPHSEGFDVVVSTAPAGPSQNAPYESPAPPPKEGAAAKASPIYHPAPTSHPSADFEKTALNALLERACQCRASDIHLQTGEAPTVRIDGRLGLFMGEDPVDLQSLFAQILSRDKLEKVRGGQSIDLVIELPRLARFRINVYQANDSLCAAVRILPSFAPDLQQLNLPISLSDLTDLPHGLVLVSGPTGSGKSATLAALAHAALQKRPILLISLEDPIEYFYRPTQNGSLTRQRQIGRDARDFPSGLRDALREDPDVILIGEMRDADSISLTLTAAETGHLVFASIHSRSAASAVERVIDTYPPERQLQVRVQLADSLRAVISQRLLPRAKGQGRIPALEVLRVNHAAASLIREGRTAQLTTLMQSSRKDGMVLLERCLADLINAGQIRLDDARSVANDPESLSNYLRA